MSKKIDMQPYFKKYEAIVAKVEGVFQKMKEKYPQEVKCKEGCSDCCNALFDLTLIEALYVNHYFNQQIKDSKKEQLIEKANKADRQTYKIKKEAYRLTQEGKKDDAVIIEEISQKRIRCPLLGDKDLCELYEYRPIACRVYGIPQAVFGKGRTCGLSGFVPGESYPTLNHDIIHDMLLVISDEFVQSIASKHQKMSDLLVPVSMALITEYDEAYLGLPSEKTETDQLKEENNGDFDK
ncbi:MAG: YkgJ family cysteine cluster protein [Desulfobacteraceae bacterium]|nr:MAG: YkgJ family cysteine cluster protein [Desulfobacteraceae bacterium]